MEQEDRQVPAIEERTAGDGVDVTVPTNHWRREQRWDDKRQDLSRDCWSLSRSGLRESLLTFSPQLVTALNHQDFFFLLVTSCNAIAWRSERLCQAVTRETRKDIPYGAIQDSNSNFLS